MGKGVGNRKGNKKKKHEINTVPFNYSAVLPAATV